MRSYLVITALIFGLLAALHVWRVIAEWSGFNADMWLVLGTAAVALALALWAIRLLGGLRRDD